MTNELTIQPKSLKTLLAADITKQKFTEVLGKKSAGFIASLLAVVNNSELLAKAEPKSILNAAMVAATLDLPINQNLGFAYIIPFNDKKSGTTLAQFQMGYKGFIQLSQRSGQFSTINVTDVKEGEIKTVDRLTGEIIFEWKTGDRDKLPTIGYVAYMRLVNGFSKSLYMTVNELKNHGLRYSQTAKKGYGLWNDDFDAMASKTVLKLLLSKYAPLTTEMQKAQLADQAIVKDDDEYEYVDNKPLIAKEVAQEKERERIVKFIAEAKAIGELEKVKEYLTDDELKAAYKNKEEFLSKEIKKEAKK